MDAQYYLAGLTVSIICCFHITDSNQIPFSVYNKMKDAKTKEEFIWKFIEKKPGPATNNEENILFTQSGSLSSSGVPIIAGMVAEPDNCIPKMQSVHIPPDSDPAVIYYPPCTKLEQCGGCCGHELLECTPTRSNLASVQVLKARSTYAEDGSDKLDFLGVVDLKLPRHLECECRCRVKAHHCNPQIHDYIEDACSCRCRNEHLATSCASNKRWDDKTCSCVCPNAINCQEDEYYNFSTCQCQRGVPSTGDDGGKNPNNDVCAYLRCRSGFVAVPSGTSCKCVPA